MESALGVSAGFHRSSHLQVVPPLGHHPFVSVPKQFLWRKLQSCQLRRKQHKGQRSAAPDGQTDGRPPGAAHLRILQLQTPVHVSEAAVASEHRPHVIVHGDLKTREEQIKASKRERVMTESSRLLWSPSLQTQSVRPSPARGGSNEEC